MNRVSLAIDLDDVLSSHVESFVKFSNANYGTNIGVEQYTEDWESLWGVEREEIERRAMEFHAPETVSSFAVKEESLKAVNMLSAKYDLFILTARKENLLTTTADWVERYYPGVFKGIHFVPVWEPNNTVTKADICKQIGATWLIDDLAYHCNLAASGGLKAILFGDYAWNRNEKLVDGVIRCRNWQKVLENFNM